MNRMASNLLLLYVCSVEANLEDNPRTYRLTVQLLGTFILFLANCRQMFSFWTRLPLEYLVQFWY